MARAFAPTALALALGACAPAATAPALAPHAQPASTSGAATEEPPPLDPAPAPPSDHARAMDRARAARDDAAAMLPPRYAGDGSAESVRAFLGAKLAPWLSARRARMQAADDGYAEAEHVALAPEQKVDALYERATMWSAFADELPRLGPVPDVIQNDAERARAYKDALDDAIAPFRDRAHDLAGRCVDVVVAENVHTPSATGCADLAARLRGQ